MASVWNVSKEPDLPFATIKDAVESGQTLDNELIKLCPGWFVESVELKKSLTIFSSEGAEKTILSKPSNADFIISIKKSRNKITGLQFAVGSYSIIIGDSSKNITNCEIKECIIKNNMFLTQKSDSNYVHHNSFYDNLRIENSSFNRIEDNVFDKSRIELDTKADDNIIKGNIIGNTKIGIQHYSYLEDVIKRNEIKNNFIGWDPNQKKLLPVEIGISLRYAQENIIEGNTIVAEERAEGDSHEIKFEYASHNTLKNNHFGLDTSSALTFPRRVSVSISDESNNNTFDKNYFVGNYFAALAIKISSMDNTIKNNFFGSEKSFVDELTLKHLRGTGVVVYQNCHNTTIDNNTFASIGACIGIKLSN
ncbi:MAG: right-handed parallel beta-helix repeat-containing protein, partial [Ignavibacteria bacterium]|nr:right-handed parallel beta-helix repeat-containing protein [Ignavibacteria bacterium]